MTSSRRPCDRSVFLVPALPTVPHNTTAGASAGRGHRTRPSVGHNWRRCAVECNVRTVHSMSRVLLAMAAGLCAPTIACGRAGEPAGAPASTSTGPATDSGGVLTHDSGTDASTTSASITDGGTDATTCATETTIDGFVYDPAGVNPLWNVTVFVPDPSSPLPDLDTIPLSCGCGALFPSAVIAYGVTDATGHFVIHNAPSGTLSLVAQAGKWRMQFDNETIANCTSTTVSPLRLPRNSSEGSLPNVAISTGGADSLECLPLRMGVSASEYVAGSADGGHLHIYTGFNGASTTPASPQSYQALWDSQDDLNSHDLVLLSCEGLETTGGNPGVAMTIGYQTELMTYANAGGRVLASHYHYVFFSSGPFDTAPDTLATWQGSNANPEIVVAGDLDAASAVVDTTLDDGAAFPQGAVLQQWLGMVGALTNEELRLWFARDNVVALNAPPSVEWMHLVDNTGTVTAPAQAFSVDTPIDASATGTCGRVIYTDLHGGGGPGVSEPGVTPDYPDAGIQGGIVPTQCASRPLTPQESAMEFMIFDLSSCLVAPGSAAAIEQPTLAP